MRIAYAGLRRREEFKALAEKLGFTPLLLPAQSTERVPVPEYRDRLRELSQGVDLFLATTGVGVRDLLEGGRALGLDLKAPLAQAHRLARGAKAARVLREEGLPPHATGDGTSPSLIPL
ncbi:uroporphyrinogen-III synthase, partial [Thermus scotoductus]